MFPSPRGVWVATDTYIDENITKEVSVPSRGMGCDVTGVIQEEGRKKFPSPRGVWVATIYEFKRL